MTSASRKPTRRASVGKKRGNPATIASPVQPPTTSPDTSALGNTGQQEPYTVTPIAELLEEWGVDLPIVDRQIKTHTKPTGEELALLQWLLDAHKADRLPAPPFQLRPAVKVAGTQFYDRLISEAERAIESGNTPRYLAGALQRDIRDIQAIVLAIGV